MGKDDFGETFRGSVSKDPAYRFFWEFGIRSPSTDAQSSPISTNKVVSKIVNALKRCLQFQYSGLNPPTRPKLMPKYTQIQSMFRAAPIIS